ncbi:MAG: DUF3237 domain-containing protein [Acidimicrobiia bacterium]
MKLEHVTDLKARLYSPVLDVGKGPYGTRYIYNAADGTFEGPKLKGRVLPGGGDMPLADADGTMRLDIRVTLETDDGAFIYLQNTGVWRNDPSKPAPEQGKAAEFGDMYIMSTPRFETGDERYRWLNDLVFVAEGKADMLEEDGYLAEVTWRIHAIVND